MNQDSVMNIKSDDIPIQDRISLGQQQLRVVDEMKLSSGLTRPKTSRGPHDRLEVVADHELVDIPTTLSPHQNSTPNAEISHIPNYRDLASGLVEAVLQSAFDNLTLLETGGSSFYASPYPALLNKGQISLPPKVLVIGKYQRSPPRKFIRRRVLQPDSGRVHADHRHISEWMAYPPHPLNTGPNRRLHRLVASAYDKQALVHPALFGFAVRWPGDNDIITESRYLHPIFSGHILNKIAIDAEKIEDLRAKVSLSRRPKNPYISMPSHSKVRSLIYYCVWTAIKFRRPPGA